MRWRRRRRRRYIDWDSWEPRPLEPIDWSRHRPGEPLPKVPAWLYRGSRSGRPMLDYEEEYMAMPWWDRLRYDLTNWDPRDYSKFPPEFEIRRPRTLFGRRGRAPGT
jgi:hypothetical protein